MLLISGPTYKPLKRLIDILGAFIGLLIFAPVMLFVAWKVKKNLGSPVIFTQLRPGLEEKVFQNYKFRSMKNAFDREGKPLPDGERLTDFGRFLRASSLDELPEFWNVLKGEMSLVGPRPLLISFLPLFDEKEALRHSVLPGITGWAQVNGRNGMTWEKRNAYDLFYVENMSLALDLRIIWMTVKTVVLREGVNAGANETIIKPPTEVKRPHILQELGYED